MKVAITLNSAWQGYNFRSNLAHSLQENGYEVIFIAPYDPVYSELLKKSFTVYTVFIDPKGIDPRHDLKTVWNLYKLYKERRPDVVLNFTIKPNIYSSLVCGILKIPCISNITGLGTIFISRSLVTKIAKYLYKIAFSYNSKVFFQNKDDKKLFLSENLTVKEKACILPGSGVDLKRFYPRLKPHNTIFKFLIIARVLKDKGIYELIDATKILKQTNKDFEVHLLGEIGVQNKTAIPEYEVNQWVSDKLIVYLGTTDNVQDTIANADCIVLPSYREGTPRSLLEGAAMQKPIITTNVTGCKEVVVDTVTGFLCEVKNSQDLADKMYKMLNLPQKVRNKMGQAGREKILKEFDEKIVIDKYLAEIKTIINKEKD
jgi:glycosyltransferase involved in cell wall biosynthesis